jgi:transcriptional regulator with XRE-family HTH domain
MTQAELARRATMSESYLRRLESAAAAPSIDLVDRLATALGVSTTDLLPPAGPADDLAVLREQARRLFEGILPTNDKQSLALLVQILARIAETTPR